MTAELLLGRVGRGVLRAYGWVLIVAILAPAAILIPMSFGGRSGLEFPPQGFSLIWYDRLVDNPRWRDAALLSLEVACCTAMLAGVLGVQAALALSRLGGWAARGLRLAFIAPVIVPLMVMAVGFYLLFAKLRILGTVASLVLAHSVLALPFVVLPVAARLAGLDPALERAAASLGAGPGRTLGAVFLPLLRPAIAAGLAFAFVFSFDEVVVAQFLSGPTLETLPRLMWEGISVGGLDKTITAVTSVQIGIAVLGIGLMQLRRGRPWPAAVAEPAVLVAAPGIVAGRPDAPREAVGIGFDRVTKRYGEAAAVDAVSLRVHPGELLTVLGPSGSGKTTLQMLVAGFLAPDEGRVLLGARDISAVPPHRRDLGVVFQNYALFPHLDVRRNVAFPLEARGMRAAEITERVRWALSLVDMAGYAGRRVHALSGGQQQRVALARAIVFGPRALLMDEPLAALDRNLRLAMQSEIRGLQQALGQTVLYVTHDQEEALSISDRVAVMRGGRLQQVDNPRDLYLRPRNPFVASFFGEANLFAGIARGDALVLPAGLRLPSPVPGSGAAVLCVRPELIRLDAPADGFPALDGRVVETRFEGSRIRLRIATPAGQVTATRPLADAMPAAGSAVRVSWPVDLTHLMAEEVA